MPKSQTLREKAASPKNLKQAWKNIRGSTRKDSHGPSEETIADFENELNPRLRRIRSELLDGTYKIGKVRGLAQRKQNNRHRLLLIAEIRDRVTQRAITRVIEPLLTKKFGLNNPASFAYLPRKGPRPAIKRMLKLYQKGYVYVLEADIQNFFGTVNTEQLLNDLIFPSLDSDTSLNDLITTALRVEIANRDKLFFVEQELFPQGVFGLPQGGYLSPLLSNVCLASFDRQMLATNYQLIRYADDFIVMCKTRKEAEEAYQLARRIIEDELGLKLHPLDNKNPKAKTRIVKLPRETIQFLGIRFTGRYILPDEDKKVKMFEKMDKVAKEADNVLEYLTRIRNLVQGWVSSYSFADFPPTYAERIDQAINLRLWRTLRRFNWKLEGKTLTLAQRQCSGIQLVDEYLRQSRINMKDSKIFSQFWTPLQLPNIDTVHQP